MYFNCTDLEDCKFYLNLAKSTNYESKQRRERRTGLGTVVCGRFPGSKGFCSRKIVLHLQAGKEGSILAVVYSTTKLSRVAGSQVPSSSSVSISWYNFPYLRLQLHLQRGLSSLALYDRPGSLQWYF